MGAEAAGSYSQYHECRAMEHVHAHIVRTTQVLNYTTHMTRDLHAQFTDIAKFPQRLQEVVDARSPASSSWKTRNVDAEPEPAPQMGKLISEISFGMNSKHWGVHEARGLNWVKRTEEVFGPAGLVTERKVKSLGELDGLFRLLAGRLETELRAEGWGSRGKEARTGVVGCAAGVEEGMRGLEEGVRGWEGEMMGWMGVGGEGGA